MMFPTPAKDTACIDRAGERRSNPDAGRSTDARNRLGCSASKAKARLARKGDVSPAIHPTLSSCARIKVIGIEIVGLPDLLNLPDANGAMANARLLRSKLAHYI
jgi:hypothetical protein